MFKIKNADAVEIVSSAAHFIKLVAILCLTQINKTNEFEVLGERRKHPSHRITWNAKRNQVTQSLGSSSSVH